MTAKRKPAARKSPTGRPVPKKTTAKAPVKRRATTSSTAAKKKKPSGLKTRPRANKPVQEKTFASIIAKLRKNLAGTNVFVLSIPWEAKEIGKIHGAKWEPDLRQFLWEGDNLPEALKPYRAKKFSLEGWIEDELNGKFKKFVPSPNPMTPRKHQQAAIKKIIGAAKAGWRGFILADTTGVGKTLSATIGAYAVAQLKGFTEAKPANVLIICPKAVIPHWRNSISASNVNNMRAVVINYDQAKKLLDVPAQALSAAKTKTKNKNTALYGTPTVRWDVIIADESHKLKNVSQRSNSFNKIARYGEDSTTAPFIIWSSATVGQAPLELGYLAPLVAQLKGTKNITMKEWGAWLIKEGFRVKESTGGSYSWLNVKSDHTPAQKVEIQKQMDEDIKKLSELLFTSTAPSIRRKPEDIAGWPTQNMVPIPVELSIMESGQYAQAWTEFRKFMQMNPRGKNPAGGLAATLRFQQKASIITAPHTADYAAELLDNGLQVAISVKFMESLDIIRDLLEKKGYKVAEFSGRNSNEREDERLRFQKGGADVIIFSVVEGVSFHANEQLPGGIIATSKERSLLVHDMRYSSIDMVQINGRTHRDGENSTASYMYSEGTIEEKILHVMIRRMRNMQNLQGDDTTDEIYELIDKA